MTWTTFNPFGELDTLHRELDRLFGERGGGTFPFSRASFLPGRAARAYPLVNVSEDEDRIYLEAMAPGVDPDTLKVSAQRDQISISGEKPACCASDEETAWHRNERAAGRFVRMLSLPTEVDADRVKAEYADGIVHVTLPKAETAKPKRIDVRVK